MRTLLVSAALVLCAPGAAIACPTWDLDPAFGAVTLQAVPPEPFSAELLAGGATDIAACGIVPAEGTAVGWFTDAPDFDLYFDPPAPATLVISAAELPPDPDAPPQPTDAEPASRAVLLLLVNAPDGTWYAASGTVEAGPVLTLPGAVAGLYDIWVGILDQGDAVPALLTIAGG